MVFSTQKHTNNPDISIKIVEIDSNQLIDQFNDTNITTNGIDIYSKNEKVIINQIYKIEILLFDRVYLRNLKGLITKKEDDFFHIHFKNITPKEKQDLNNIEKYNEDSL